LASRNSVTPSLDHLVGGREQRGWYFETYRFGSLLRVVGAQVYKQADPARPVCSRDKRVSNWRCDKAT
jgi:hypothetical protein